jgi:hypothetical protein
MPDRPARSDSAQRLGGLRRSQPADVTLRNLLALLTSKLDLCASLPVWEWEAANEGHEESADCFSAFAEAERRSTADVIACLRTHLEHTAPGGA